MNNSIRRGLTLYFNDDTHITFQFPVQLSDPSMITRYVDDVLKHQYIMIEAEGAVQLYPLANIRRLQVFPAPEVLPQNCIKGATISE